MFDLVLGHDAPVFTAEWTHRLLLPGAPCAAGPCACVRLDSDLGALAAEHRRDQLKRIVAIGPTVWGQATSRRRQLHGGV